MTFERREPLRRADARLASRTVLSLFAFLGVVSYLLLPADASAARVLELTIDDAIGPVSASFLESGLERAVESEFDAVVIALDTPGGLDLSMRSMVKAILASPVPVIVYVSPSGARAASAGLFIALAAPVAIAVIIAAGAGSPLSFVALRKPYWRS